MANADLKRNIKKQMNEYKSHAEGVRRTLKQSNPKYEVIQVIGEYFSSMSKYHSTTLVILLAIEKKKSIEKLVEVRKDTMLALLSQMPILVGEGLMTENEYLEKCNEFKRDLEMLVG